MINLKTEILKHVLAGDLLRGTIVLKIILIVQIEIA
jgi:hypothetical protein